MMLLTVFAPWLGTVRAFEGARSMCTTVDGH
jgi:hypothetical protein